jgi:hypothetical protein
MPGMRAIGHSEPVGSAFHALAMARLIAWGGGRGDQVSTAETRTIERGTTRQSKTIDHRALQTWGSHMFDAQRSTALMRSSSRWQEKPR